MLRCLKDAVDAYHKRHSYHTNKGWTYEFMSEEFVSLIQSSVGQIIDVLGHHCILLRVGSHTMHMINVSVFDDGEVLEFWLTEDITHVVASNS